MVVCRDCGRECKSAAGLASHRRSSHASSEVEAGNGANRVAVEVTIAELRRCGRFETVDAAQIQAARSIADALDDNPHNSQLWREYRGVLEALTDDGDDDGGIAALLEELSGTSVRDSPSS